MNKKLIESLIVKILLIKTFRKMKYSIFLFIANLACANAFLSLLMSPFARETPTQHVTVCTRFGHIFKNQTLDPGLHMRNSLTTTCYDIYAQEQIDTVTVTVGSSDGIKFKFIIEVSNKLPKEYVENIFERYGVDYDKLTIFKWVEFYMGQMCSQMTAEEIYMTQYSTLDDRLKEKLIQVQIDENTGIIVIKVKMVKPECISSSFCEDTKRRAESAAKEAALKADQKRIEAKKENELAILKGEQDRQTQQRKGELQRNLLSIEAKKKEQIIKLQMETDKAKNEANLTMIKSEAKASATIKEAEAEAAAMEIKAKAEKERLTPAFLSWHWAKSFFESPNNKMYFGEKIPSMSFLPGNK